MIPLEVEYVRQDRPIDEGTYSEDFTSDSDVGSTDTDDTNTEEKEEYVIMVMDEDQKKEGETEKEKTEEELVDDALKHLNRATRRAVKRLLVKRGLIAQSLNDLRPSQVPVQHAFELKDKTPIYHKARRMSPRHNLIVREELDKMWRQGLSNQSRPHGPFQL